MRSGQGLTSFNKDNIINFSEGKRNNEAFRGVYFLTFYAKKLSIKSLAHSLSHPPILRSPILCKALVVGVHWAADCARQWFNILGSIDYNYSFFRLDWRATPNPWNWIEINIQSGDSRLKQETMGIIFNWDISATHHLPHPHLSAPQARLYIVFLFNGCTYRHTERDFQSRFEKDLTFIERFKL